MRIVIFCHSLLSDWNHGNAHFLRGVSSELIARGHDVRVFEPHNAWSLASLTTEFGVEPVNRFHDAYPGLSVTRYDSQLDLDHALDGADLVLVHEWIEPALAEQIGLHRARSGRYVLLFHDTHHRSVTDPASMSRYDLQHYDGVLAFGNSVAEVYRRRGWATRVWTWHEAADTRVFHPIEALGQDGDLVWIGNWGDDERTAELREFLIAPVADLKLRARVYGVRYPEAAIESLLQAGIQYGGWLPNFDAPQVYARFGVTVHVPRRPYASALPGVPTIRMFEALACGIPLVSAPWHDSENLFTPGEDFLVAEDGQQMRTHLRALLSDREFAASIANNGLRTILRRHTCRHRVDELMDICEGLRPGSALATEETSF